MLVSISYILSLKPHSDQFSFIQQTHLLSASYVLSTALDTGQREHTEACTVVGRKV